jgi:hypothetical protein
MAVTTVNDAIRHVDTGRYTFFGYPVPENVSALIMSDNRDWDSKTIKWRVKGDSTIHEIDFPHATEENILAVLAAMRLSC